MYTRKRVGAKDVTDEEDQVRLVNPGIGTSNIQTQPLST